MEKLNIVAKTLKKHDRLLSGLLRVSSVLTNPEKYYDTVDSIGGWIKTARAANKGKLLFIALSDGSCSTNIQIVVNENITNFAKLCLQKPPACLKVTGKLVKSPGKGQPIEILIEDNELHKIEILGENMNFDDYPLSAKNYSLEHLRKFLHLRPKSNYISSMSRVRNALAMATHQFFQELGFIYVHTPIITTSDCEGAGEMFQVTTLLPQTDKISEVPELVETTEKTVDGKIEKEEVKTGKVDYKNDFFKNKTSLTVSGQLAVENYACGLTNVYTFGPTFRAENSHTNRHLSEFWMIEPEICFAGLEELFALTEGYVKFCIDYTLKNVKDDIEYFSKAYARDRKKSKAKKGDGFEDLLKYLERILTNKFERMSYTQAIELLMEAMKTKKVKFKNNVYWGVDLASEHERYISEVILKAPVFIYNYPKEIKSFYMKLNDDGKTVQGTDLLLPFIGEVVGGSVREERLDVLEEQMKVNGLDKEDYQFYLDLRKYGTVPHAGFGLGFERLVMLCTGIKNIRDAIPYPRYPGHCED